MRTRHSAMKGQGAGSDEVDDRDNERSAWIRRSDAQEERERLTEALKGWWKLARPFRAWGLYRKLRATNEASRRRANDRLLRKRVRDPALANLNEDQRQAIIVQEDRTLIVVCAGTGKTHTMVAKARDTVRTGIARTDEIAFVTFTRKAAQEIREVRIATTLHLADIPYRYETEFPVPERAPREGRKVIPPGLLPPGRSGGVGKRTRTRRRSRRRVAGALRERRER